MKKIIIILLLTTTLFTACRKESSQPADADCRTATIQYWGLPAADGLGWVLVTDSATGSFEAPENLPAAYEAQGLVVNVCYVKTDKDLICFCAQPFKKMVHITNISK
jgi:hypothetical protein